MSVAFDTNLDELTLGKEERDPEKKNERKRKKTINIGKEIRKRKKETSNRCKRRTLNCLGKKEGKEK